jgi:tetratricopeptide (TPR) repeat protein
MKHCIVGWLVLLTVTTGFGQKVNLDKFWIKPSWVQLPRNPLPAEFTTYSTEFTAVGVDLSSVNFAPKDLKQAYFSISGFRKVDKGGHVTINVQIDKPQFDKFVVIAEDYTVKKDSVTIKKTKYYFQFQTVIPVRYALEDVNQAILEEGAISDGSKPLPYKSAEFTEKPLLDTYWIKNKAEILRTQWTTQLGSVLGAFQQRLNADYGYVPVRQQSDELWILNSSRHPEYAAYKEAYQTINGAIEAMTPERPLDSTALQPAIAYLKGLPARFPSDDKADRKLRYSAYFNLSKIYYWLDDFTAATAQAKALIQNEYDKFDGELLIQDAVMARSLVRANRTVSRHLVRDVSRAEAPVTARMRAEDAERSQREEAQKQAKKEESIAKFNNAVQELRTIYGQIEAKREQAKKDIAKLDTTISKGPTTYKLFANRAQLKQYVGDYAGAATDFEQALGLKPKDVAYLRAIGENGRRAGALDKSLKAYDAWLGLSPKNDEIMYLKGLVLYDASRYAEAADWFSRSVAINPKRVDAYIQRGWTLDMMGRYADALNDMFRAAALDPKLAEPVLGMGYVRNSLKQYDDALVDFAKALVLDPSMGRIFANRAVALASVGRLDEAAASVDRALQTVPNYANGFYIRSYVRVKQKNYQGAIEDARQSLAFGHRKPYQSYTTLGDAMLGLGIRDEALKMYDEALRIKPDFADATEARQRAAAAK